MVRESFNCIIAEDEIQAEKEKLYQALGYSENAMAAIYPKEVHITHTLYS